MIVVIFSLDLETMVDINKAACTFVQVNIRYPLIASSRLLSSLSAHYTSTKDKVLNTKRRLNLEMTGQGYIDPNWPNPQGPHDARIIIYGFVNIYLKG
jgi:hypothetical protein